MTVNIHQKPEVISIAHAVGLSQYDVVGRLIAVWSWANIESKNGFIAKATPETIDALLGGIAGFGKAMEAQGWLISHPDGVEIPLFEKYHMATTRAQQVGEDAAERRKQQARERKRRERERKKQAEKGCHGHAQDRDRDIENNPPYNTPPETPEKPNGNGRTKASAGETDAGLAGADNATDAAAETPDSDAGTDRRAPRRDPPKPAKRESRVADDFWPDESGERVFRECNGRHLPRAVEHFLDYWRACGGKKGTKADWQATWRNWCRSAAEREYSSPGFGNGNGTRSGPSEPGLANLFAAASSRGDDGY